MDYKPEEIENGKLDHPAKRTRMGVEKLQRLAQGTYLWFPHAYMRGWEVMQREGAKKLAFSGE